MFDLSGLNWLAILVATVAGFLLGGIWYGPAFGKAWLAAVGKREEDLGSPAGPMTVSFFTGLVTSIALALLIRALGITTLGDGLAIGALTSVGFIATGMASDYAFCGWGAKLFAIQSGYRVAYSLIMGAILAVWR